MPGIAFLKQVKCCKNDLETDEPNPENRPMKVTNLVFWVQENRISEKFYQKVGFELVESDDSHSRMRENGFDIVLVNMRDDDLFARDSMIGKKGKGMYVYIEVLDVDKKYKELKSYKIKTATEPKDWPQWGNREFIVKDPDGYKLCFWAPIKTKKS
jgi:uncharacterized glyoxalase superfamily protein PhnB